MNKFLKSIFKVLLGVTFAAWFSFVVIRHADGDIIFANVIGLNEPEFRNVCFGLPHSKNDCMTENSKYWIGGDLVDGTQPNWVFLIPCEICTDQIGGDWYDGTDYSKWIPTF